MSSIDWLLIGLSSNSSPRGKELLRARWDRYGRGWYERASKDAGSPRAATAELGLDPLPETALLQDSEGELRPTSEIERLERKRASFSPPPTLFRDSRASRARRLTQLRWMREWRALKELMRLFLRNFTKLVRRIAGTKLLTSSDRYLSFELKAPATPEASAWDGPSNKAGEWSSSTDLEACLTIQGDWQIALSDVSCSKNAGGWVWLRQTVSHTGDFPQTVA
jgi:hypothetical protein